jgi:hypothetical protein
MTKHPDAQPPASRDPIRATAELVLLIAAWIVSKRTPQPQEDALTGEAPEAASESHHTGKLGSVVGTLLRALIAHIDKQHIGDAQQRDGPGSPSADVQRAVEYSDYRAEGQVGHPHKPLQSEVHAGSLRCASGGGGISRNEPLVENESVAKSVKPWWVPLILLATWSAIGGLSMVRGSTRLDVSLALIAVGVIIGALAPLPELRSVVPYMGVASGAIGGLGAVLAIAKVSETRGLWVDMRTVAITGVVATALAILIRLAVKSVALKVLHH